MFHNTTYVDTKDQVAHRELEAAAVSLGPAWPEKEVSSTSLWVTGPEPQVESFTFWQSEGEVHLGIRGQVRHADRQTPDKY